MTTTRSSAPAAGPATQVPAAGGRQRIASLDVLRGIAILGTLLTNIAIFTSDSGPSSYGAQGWHWLDTVTSLVTDGKWIGLLTIMFGVGLEIQRQSAMKRDEPWLGTYPWRGAILVLDGSLNFIFVFEWDVLMGYGTTAILLAFLLTTSERWHKWILLAGVSTHLAYLTYQSQVWTWFGSTPMQRLSQADITLLDTDPADLTSEQIAHAAKLTNLSPSAYAESWGQGFGLEVPERTYWSHTQERWDTWSNGRPGFLIMLTLGFALFMVGVMLYRKGLFYPEGRKLRLWVMGLSFGVGLPLDWGTRLFLTEYTSTYNRYFTSACVTVGVMALVAHFYAGGRQPGAIGRPLAMVGKMALSNYLLQNLLGAVLFYGYFLALGRYWQPEWPPLLDLAAWLLISAIMVTFSWWWLRSHERGPVEYVWNWSLRTVAAIVPTRWEPRVRRADALKAAERELSASQQQPASVS